MIHFLTWFTFTILRFLTENAAYRFPFRNRICIHPKNLCFVISIMFIGRYRIHCVTYKMLQEAGKACSWHLTPAARGLWVYPSVPNKYGVDNLGRFVGRPPYWLTGITGQPAGLTDGVSHIFKGESRGSLTVVAFFCTDCLKWVANDFRWPARHPVAYALCIECSRVTSASGATRNWRTGQVRPKCFSADSLWTYCSPPSPSLHCWANDVFDCMAVVWLLIILSSFWLRSRTFLGPAARHGLGTIALRQYLKRWWSCRYRSSGNVRQAGTYISAAGVNSMDVYPHHPIFRKDVFYRYIHRRY